MHDKQLLNIRHIVNLINIMLPTHTAPKMQSHLIQHPAGHRTPSEGETKMSSESQRHNIVGITTRGAINQTAPSRRVTRVSGSAVRSIIHSVRSSVFICLCSFVCVHLSVFICLCLFVCVHLSVFIVHLSSSTLPSEDGRAEAP